MNTERIDTIRGKAERMKKIADAMEKMADDLNAEAERLEELATDLWDTEYAKTYGMGM